MKGHFEACSCSLSNGESKEVVFGSREPTKVPLGVLVDKKRSSARDGLGAVSIEFGRNHAPQTIRLEPTCPHSTEVDIG